MEIILHLTLKLQSLLSNRMLNTKGKAFKTSQFNKTKQKKKKKVQYGEKFVSFFLWKPEKSKGKEITHLQSSQFSEP